MLVRCSSVPASSELFYGVSDYPDVAKIDTHIHIFTEEGTFMEVARDNNFRVINIALDASNDMSSVRRQFRYCQIQKEKYPSAVEIASAFSMEGWDEPDWLSRNLAWLDSCINNGAIAVKIWKNIGMVYRDKEGKLIMIDDRRFDPIFRMLTEKNIPVIGHLGEPKNCWLPLEEMTTNNDRNYFREHPQYHMYKHPELPSYQKQVGARDRMLEKNPKLIFAGAHAGSLEWSVDTLAGTLDRFPNMSVDLAARMGQIFYQTNADREKVREFFVKYQDRILYATDMGARGGESKETLAKELHETWMRDWKFFVTDDSLNSSLVNVSYKGLKLPRQVVDKIYFKNAQRWLHVFEDKVESSH